MSLPLALQHFPVATMFIMPVNPFRDSQITPFLVASFQQILSVETVSIGILCLESRNGSVGCKVAQKERQSWT